MVDVFKCCFVGHYNLHSSFHQVGQKQMIPMVKMANGVLLKWDI